ncbi:MAG TPA: site-specific integrase [Gemmatimonadales bacterium]|jgi:integrase
MRGSGRVFKPKARGRETRLWWLDYSLHGQRHREPAGTASKSEAQRLLREKMAARESGKLLGRPERVTFSQLRATAERQYVLDGRRSLDRLQDAFAHLERILSANSRAPDITTARLDAYAEQRMREKASRATVNYELAAMRRAFRLAIEKGILAVMPFIRLPAVRNQRSGFFEDGDFAALVLELPNDIQPLVRFLRLTGWRRSEALGLTWDQVDLDAGIMRLAAAVTKGGDARLFPFGLAPEIVQLLKARKADQKGPFVFHRNGKRIGVMALRGAWMRACKRAGLEGRLVHDLRRSAARDLRRAGVSEGEIMKLCGWRTRSMFDRYNIIDEQDLARAVAKRFNGKQAANNKVSRDEAEALS